MGFVPCPFACTSDHESQSHTTNSNPLLSQLSSASSSLSSLPSLPSIPSLTPSSSLSSQHDHQIPAVHHHCLATLTAPSSSVFSLALSRNFLYSGSSNSQIRAWMPYPFAHTQDSPAILLPTTKGAVKSLVITGDKLVSAHQDCKIRVWKIDSINQKFNCISTLPNFTDRFLRFFAPKNYVKVRRHKKRTWVHHVDTVSALAISTDGSLLFSASWDRSFKVWRTSDFRCLESVTNAHEDAINALVLSDDGFVYTGSADNKIKVWKKGTGEKKHSLVATKEGHKSAVNALALSCDGSVLYSGACDRSILVWESVNGGVIGALRGHRKAILCLAVEGDLVCSGSGDNTVRIWRRGIEDKRSYSCLAVFEGHTRPVKCLTIITHTDTTDLVSDCEDSSNYLVYSGSLDCDIRIWHICVPSNSFIIA